MPRRTALDETVAFIALIAARNTPSRKVAERLGLTNHGLGVDPSDGQRRLVYADREVGDSAPSRNYNAM